MGKLRHFLISSSEDSFYGRIVSLVIICIVLFGTVFIGYTNLHLDILSGSPKSAFVPDAAKKVLRTSETAPPQKRSRSVLSASPSAKLSPLNSPSLSTSPTLDSSPSAFIEN